MALLGSFAGSVKRNEYAGLSAEPIRVAFDGAGESCFFSGFSFAGAGAGVGFGAAAAGFGAAAGGGAQSSVPKGSGLSVAMRVQQCLWFPWDAVSRSL
jgi:hypothetical protein